MEDKQYIVPPRLNEKLIYCGFQAVEALIIFVVLFLGIFTGFLPLVAVSAILFVLWFRAGDKTNLLMRLKAVHHFYFSFRTCTAKGVKRCYESSTYNTADRL